MKLDRLLLAALVFLAARSLLPAQQTPDPAAADRQYRIARRLVAEGAAEAREALSRVLELDPRGALADDVLLDQARLVGIPGWADELSALDRRSAVQANELLDRALAEFPQGDRRVEILYSRGLLRLLPTVLRDPSAARIDLLAVATEQPATEWNSRARFALARLYESEGRHAAASDAYQRLLVDAPSGDAALRARVALAGISLRSGGLDDAAAHLQQAIEIGPPAGSPAASLRELAMRLILESAGIDAAGGALRTFATGVRAVDGFGSTPSGGVVFGDRRGGRVVELDRSGRKLADYPLSELETMTIDSTGRIYAVAAGQLFLLNRNGSWIPIATVADLGPPSAIAADRHGNVWLVDRRGQQIARVDAGATTARVVFESRDSRLVAIAWDGRRLVAVDARRRNVLAIDLDGASGVLPFGILEKPLALAADPAGRLAVLDAKTLQLHFYRDGLPPVVRDLALDAIGRPEALALALDGSVDLFDGAEGLWRHRP